VRVPEHAAAANGRKGERPPCITTSPMVRQNNPLYAPKASLLLVVISSR
jgi:hypothetical protein